MELGAHSHGKSGVRVARAFRRADGTHGWVEYSAALQLEGATADSFTRGDNTMVVATDTVKNHVYVVAKTMGEFEFSASECVAIELARHLLETYAHLSAVRAEVQQVAFERARVPRAESAYEQEDAADVDAPHAHGFVRAKGEHGARVRIARAQREVEVESWVSGLELLKTTQSGWEKFFSDRWTTLPETRERVLATAVQCCWRARSHYDRRTRGDGARGAQSEAHLFCTTRARLIRSLLRAFFGDPARGVYSDGVQHTMYEMACAALRATPTRVSSVQLVLPNIHYLPCRIPAFERNRILFEDDVYIPTSEPSGRIECTLLRSSIANAANSASLLTAPRLAAKL